MQYVCSQISIACDYSNTQICAVFNEKIHKCRHIQAYHIAVFLFIHSTNSYYISTRSKALFSNGNTAVSQNNKILVHIELIFWRSRWAEIEKEQMKNMYKHINIIWKVTRSAVEKKKVRSISSLSLLYQSRNSGSSWFDQTHFHRRAFALT